MMGSYLFVGTENHESLTRDPACHLELSHRFALLSSWKSAAAQEAEQHSGNLHELYCPEKIEMNYWPVQAPSTCALSVKWAAVRNVKAISPHGNFQQFHIPITIPVNQWRAAQASSFVSQPLPAMRALRDLAFAVSDWRESISCKSGKSSQGRHPLPRIRRYSMHQRHNPFLGIE